MYNISRIPNDRMLNRWLSERSTGSRYKRVEFRVVLGCVFNFMMCSKVIYTGRSRLRSATGILMVIFIDLVQYAKNLNEKYRKNLVEHPMIKDDKKI